MGRLAISRGFPSDDLIEGVILPPIEPSAPAAASVPAIDAMATVQARLDVLERLARLCEAGVLTVDEFLIEKAAILGHPRSALMGQDDGVREGPISFQPARPSQPKRGRSLVGRLGWFVLPVGLAAGIGLSALSQPEATERAFLEISRLIGL